MMFFIFDAIIAVILAGIPLWIFFAHRKFSIWSICGIIVWGTVLYGSFIEPRFLTVQSYDIHIGDGGRMLRVAVIADTHLGVYRHADWLTRVVEKTNTTSPDLVLVAGDIVSTATGLREMSAFAQLQSTYGTYAALGNWDYRVGAVDVRKAIESHNVEVLTNESVTLRASSHDILLAGIDDIKYGNPDLEKALLQKNTQPLTILLTHNPDIAPRAETYDIDLVVAGHTHAGQIRLPFIGSVPPLPTKLGRYYDKGVFYFGPTKLFITPGVGESGVRARLFNPPEISVLNISY